ncbi:toxin-antitoxin system YwqK family antitoxin [Pontibacter pudoricolor]|uniref:toxin-antitoxin system YwqK family antitoxin n=1 Tax=Pontibacter pudoricolor TaxID=2694930 RepID=UPI001EE464B9|nr:hypothetical protein [Pontibacter pudoricolor]
MNKNLLLILLLFVAPVIVHAQAEINKTTPVKVKKWYHFFRTNAFDKEGAYHGRWKIYINNDQDLVRNGRFRHGKEVGIWRYYYPGGGIYMVEKHKWRSGDIQVRKYHENGNLARTGQAKMISNEEEAHYYWEGVWQVYDEQGNFTHTETYVKGHLLTKQAQPIGQ